MEIIESADSFGEEMNVVSMEVKQGKLVEWMTFVLVDGLFVLCCLSELQCIRSPTPHCETLEQLRQEPLASAPDDR